MPGAHHVQAVVVGAGVVGLAVARALAIRGKEVLVLEKADTFGTETSSRNSQVIHAGIYYPKGSLKANFCVEGRHMLYEFCRDRDIPFRRCGKLIVDAGTDNRARLAALKDKAEQNGVDDIRFLSCEDVGYLEPALKDNTQGLLSPSTGVLDSHSFLQSLIVDAEDHGAMLVYRTQVTNIICNKQHEDLHIETQDGTQLTCNHLINCAGLWAAKVANFLHPSKQRYRQYYCKGNYFRLAALPPFQHLVYPLPNDAGLGIHATLDYTASTTHFGPDVEWIDPDTCLDSVNWNASPQRLHDFEHEIRNYWPDLPQNVLVPDYAGVRPKLYHPTVEKRSFGDFVVDGPKDHGVPGVYHLLGIESPGLTSSMCLAKHVAERVVAD